MKKPNFIQKILVWISYIVMITVNALANILPINNIPTGAVSDSYPNLFAPAGLTFSIWGVIYLLLGAYSVYQITSKKTDKKLIHSVNTLFIISSLINSAWIFTWHYRIMAGTVILMLGLLWCLIKIAELVRRNKLSFTDKLLIKAPFGIYFGWITIATIANITTFLVSVGWNGFGIPDATWMIVVLTTGLIISIWRMIKDSSIAYGLVPVWAYYGIWFKHTSASGFNNMYSVVINVVLVYLAILISANVFLIYRKRAL